MDRLFHTLSLRGPWLILSICMAMGLAKHLYFDEPFLPQLLIAFAYAFPMYGSHMFTKRRFRHWPVLAHYLFATPLGVITGTLAIVLLYGELVLSADIMQLITLFLLGLFVALGVSFVFYLKGRAVYLEAELNRVKLLSSHGRDEFPSSDYAHYLYQQDIAFAHTVITEIDVLILTNTQKASDLSGCLMNLLKSSAERTRTPLVSLQEEIVLLEAYLSVHKTLHKSQFDYFIDVDDRLSFSNNCPRYLLRPLIGGIISYIDGTEEKPEIIYVDFEQVDDRMMIIIRNQGIGLESLAASEDSKILRFCQYQVEQLFDDDGEYELQLDTGLSTLSLSWQLSTNEFSMADVHRNALPLI
uniref:hypothetical protein n=1 Tax=Thaumasiovibrio occultus TaxID=1891184 RepID=UPI000B35716D|nr:hypothetical protein [Thaumasiovibrio occultus]